MQTSQMTLTTTAQQVVEFDVGDFDNITLIAEADWYLFLNGGSGDGFKVLANSAVEFTPQMFAEQSKSNHERVRLSGKVAAGNTTLYIARMSL